MKWLLQKHEKEGACVVLSEITGDEAGWSLTQPFHGQKETLDQFTGLQKALLRFCNRVRPKLSTLLDSSEKPFVRCDFYLDPTMVNDCYLMLRKDERLDMKGVTICQGIRSQSDLDYFQHSFTKALQDIQELALASPPRLN